MQNTVYLVCFDRAYVAKTGKQKKQALHYIGWTPDLTARVALHAKGQGARLMEIVTQEGIGWRVVRTWDGGRAIERKMKNRKRAAALCPCCNRKIAHLLLPQAHA